jgi:hypothetical protein
MLKMVSGKTGFDGFCPLRYAVAAMASWDFFSGGHIVFPAGRAGPVTTAWGGNWGAVACVVTGVWACGAEVAGGAFFRDLVVCFG